MNEAGFVKKQPAFKPDNRLGQGEETDEERERADKLFTSNDRREAFRRLSVTTALELEQAMLHYKKKVLLDLLGKKEVNQNIVREHKTVYLGASTDIEYPLCLGGRNIVLVDPTFKDEVGRLLILNKIKDMGGHEPTKISEDEYSFLFDFGNGVEAVSVELVGKSYASREEFSEYKMPDKVGLILSFITPSGPTAGHPLDARVVRDKLVAGGMILVFGEALDETTMNQERGRFLNKNFGGDIEEAIRIFKGDGGALLSEEARWIFKRHGYELVPTDPFEYERVEGGRVTAEMGEVTTFLKKGTVL